MQKTFKPGETAPRSGQYITIGPRGGRGSEITSIKGKPLPPTPLKNSGYELVDATKHKSGN